MMIVMEQRQYILGEAVPVEIIYANTSSQAIELQDDPAKSLDVIMNMVDQKTGYNIIYSLGKTIVTELEGDQFAWVEPIPEPFVIAPESQYTIKSDMNEQLQISPGKFECYLVEYDLKESNRVEVVIRYTHESVDKLLRIAAEPSEEYGRREWADGFIRDIYPDFRLKLPYPKNQETIKKEKENYNTKVVEQFSHWWKENRDSAKVNATLKQINDQAGANTPDTKK